MKINNNSEIPTDEVQMEGAHNVRMKILIGKKDGSDNIFMRHFFVAPGGNTPYHQHNYEHVVKNRSGFFRPTGIEKPDMGKPVG